MQETVAAFGLPFFLALAGLDILLFLLLRWLLSKRIESRTTVIGISVVVAIVLAPMLLFGLLRVWNALNS
ncbi:hypothetical protein Q5H93_16265 [Hymenobacter sp. ASUV-10]|uniref:Cardiolipin synthase N-terminal domain-containing protein n=1 Tax=Hymenobacter aranciens TaxID=3063996 RepID=A0ABT9BDG0_9BACT|nr:hypothetical protein [Hymenobacter sp. ASUV-10]MDO7876300.1 hypothetical protein [Hymenobacter sp. ASUV-10]